MESQDLTPKDQSFHSEISSSQQAALKEQNLILKDKVKWMEEELKDMKNKNAIYVEQLQSLKLENRRLEEQNMKIESETPGEAN